MRPCSLAELNMHAHRAQLVRTVSIPRLHAQPSLTSLLEIFVERAIEERPRQTACFPARTHRDRRRRRIEIGQLHRPRDVVDLARDHYLTNRLEQVCAEAVPHLGERSRLRSAQLLCDERRVLESPQCKEIIPVGMHRLRTVAFMTYGLRQ